MSDVDTSAPDETGPPEMPVGTKKALLIGINYLGTANKLSGCIQDARNQYQVLTEHFGFKEENVRLLTEDQNLDETEPTKRNMLDGIQWLMEGAQEGDVLFFHYSGHGSQVPDPTGEEEDGQNECLCPVDCMFHDWPGAVIVDDDLNDMLFDALPDGVRLTCVYDCCHSGTMMDLVVNRDICFDPNPTKPRFMNPPPDVMDKLSSMNDRDRPKKRSLTRGLHKAKQCWTMSGCQDDQTSADANIDGVQQGALTWAIMTSLEQCNYDITYEELLNCSRKMLKRKYTQIPSMSTTDEGNFSAHYVGCGQ